MRKNILLSLIALISITLIFNSCKKSSSTFTVIPKDTKAILVMDLSSLLKKSDFINMKDYSFYNFMIEEVENEDKDLAVLIEDFFKDPTQSGINVFDDSFVYYVDEGEDEKFVVWTLPLKKSGKFEEWLKKIIETTDEDFDVEDKGKYKLFNIEDEVIITWNKSSVLFVIPIEQEDNLEDISEYLMTLEKENQISENADFKDFYSSKKDVSFWLDYSIISDIDEYSYYADQIDKNLSDMKLSVFIEFLDGEIRMSSLIDVPEDSKLAEIYDGKFNEDLLKYSPDKSLALISFAFSPEALKNYLTENPSFSGVNDMVEQQIGYSVEDILDAFGGSLMLNLYDFESKEVEATDWDLVYDEELGTYEYEEVIVMKNKINPLGFITFDIKDKDLFNTLINIVVETGSVEEHDNYYSFESQGFEYYFGVTDNFLFVATDKEFVDNLDNGFSSNLTNTDFGKNIKDNSYYLYANMNLNEYPEFLFEEMLENEPDAQLAFDFVNETFDYIEMKSSGKMQGQISIYLKDDSENSLKALLKSIDKLTQEVL